MPPKKTGYETQTTLAVASSGVHFRLEVSYVSVPPFLGPKIRAELQICEADGGKTGRNQGFEPQIISNLL